MGRILRYVQSLGAKLLPQFEPTPAVVTRDETTDAPPPMVGSYSDNASAADLLAAGIRSGMSAEEIEDRLARVMGPACVTPPSH